MSHIGFSKGKQRQFVGQSQFACGITCLSISPLLPVIENGTNQHVTKLPPFTTPLPQTCYTGVHVWFNPSPAPQSGPLLARQAG